MPSGNIVKKVIFKNGQLAGSSHSIISILKSNQFNFYIYVYLFIFQEKRDSSKINPVHWTPPLDDADEPPESRLGRGRPIKVFNIS